MPSNRLPPIFLTVIDDEGRRFAIKISSIQFLADGDAFQDTTIIMAAGRAICIPRPLDDLCKELNVCAPIPDQEQRYD
ncbi:MAG: hypothetical protein HY985_10730 [Magnetospirillum sp.]|nr:hypothetical protein [Magnetospirillum sp.]